MQRRFGRVGRLVALCITVGGILDPSVAGAFHSDQQRITAGTAYTLGESSDWKVGLWSAEYAAHRRLDVGTYVWPWLFRVANWGVKYEYRFSDSLSVGPRLHLFRLDVQKLNPDAQPVKIAAIPFELNGSYRWSDYTASLQAIYTYIHVEGSLEEGALEGAAAISNLQLVSTLEYRWTKVTALWLRLRYLAYQWQPSASAVYVLHPNDFTTVEVHGAAEVQMFDVSHAYSIVPGVQWSWETFNLRAGLGYGNYNLGPVNFVVPRKTLVPEFDLFWRW